MYIIINLHPSKFAYTMKIERHQTSQAAGCVCAVETNAINYGWNN